MSTALTWLLSCRCVQCLSISHASNVPSCTFCCTRRNGAELRGWVCINLRNKFWSPRGPITLPSSRQCPAKNIPKMQIQCLVCALGRWKTNKFSPPPFPQPNPPKSNKICNRAWHNTPPPPPVACLVILQAKSDIPTQNVSVSKCPLSWASFGY